MQLKQVERVRLEMPQTVFDEAREVGGVVASGDVRVQAASGFGCDNDLFLAIFLQLGDEAFGPAHTVDVGGVYEIDAAVDGLVEGGERFLVVGSSPRAADGPGAEADVRYVPACAAEWSVIHLF